MKIKKIFTYALIGTLITSNAMPVLAYTNSIANIDATQNVTENGTSQTSVYAELGSEFTVTVPKSITLSGLSKTGTYTVSVLGDIAGKDKINVIPDETFTLNSQGLNGITASISQDKTEWSCSEITTDSAIVGNGTINASNLSAGKWNGTFNFNINLKGSGITVEAKDENGNDLNASASEITGTEKESLLTSLEQTGMITSKDEVNALIEVESNEFDGIADTTFDVSSIANEGDKIAILHFDETKQEWEYIGTKTVDSNGLISSDFTSYSPVAFVKITENNQTENIEYTNFTISKNNYKQAGITSLTGDLIIPATFEYEGIRYKITGIGQEGFRDCSNLTSIIIPNTVTSMGSYSFYYCTNLTNVEILGNVSGIAYYQFAGCSKLSTVTLPSSVTSFSFWAFSGCTKLTTINYKGTEEQWNLIEKNTGWNHNCPSDMKIVYNYTE